MYQIKRDVNSPYLRKGGAEMVSGMIEKKTAHKNATNIPMQNSVSGNIVLVNDTIKRKCSHDLQKSNNGEDDFHVQKIKKSNHTVLRKRHSKCGKNDNNRFDSIISSCNSCKAKMSKMQIIGLKEPAQKHLNPHDVWEILRGLNRFQFRPSPQISEDSFVVKNVSKTHKNLKNLRIFESRRSEEYTYISSYRVGKSPSYSNSSSFDKVTVIDKKQNQNFTRSSILAATKKKSKNSKNITHVQKTQQPKLPLINITKSESSDKSSKYKHDAMVNNTTSVDLGYESKTTEHDEDLLNYEHDSCNRSQYSAAYSNHSGSSKAVIFRQVTPKKAEDRRALQNSINIEKQKISANKVTTSQAENESNTVSHKVKRIRKYTYQPANNPKFTKTEIARQLNKYKFPIIVLGKNQLRSSVHITNEEHPQFCGLDKHIWPFMQSWCGANNFNRPIKRQLNRLNKGGKFEDMSKNQSKTNNMLKQMTVKDKTPNEIEKKTLLPLPDIISHVANQRKTQPVRDSKDRMLTILYKKSLPSVNNDSFGLDKDIKLVRKGDKWKNVQKSFDRLDRDSSLSNSPILTFSANNKRLTIKNNYLEKHIWSKSKRLNNNIENVMNKIKIGFYYSNEKVQKPNKFDLALNEEHVISESCYTEKSSKETILPGFDDIIPRVEIKSMNMKEVAIKHCTRNIIIIFDVTISTTPITNVNKTPLLVPVNITKSLTKVFKHQESICCNMLPAELCSILPRLLHGDIDTIDFSELINTPCINTVVQTPPEYTKELVTLSSSYEFPSILKLPTMSSALRNILNGTYVNKVTKLSPKFHILKNLLSLQVDDIQMKQKIRPLLKHYLLDHNWLLPIRWKGFDNTNKSPTTVNVTPDFNSCRAIQIYKPHNCSLPYESFMMKPYPLIKVFNFMANTFSEGLSRYDMLLSCNGTNTKKITNPVCATFVFISLNISNFRTRSPNKHIDCTSVNKTITVPKIEYKPIQAQLENIVSEKFYEIQNGSDEKPAERYTVHKKTKRKCFSKLYRKCKSASNIHGSQPKPLEDIKNMDDFLEVLGSAKFLATVFDSQSSDRVLKLIKEMRNWSSGISSQQALLILLLSIKNDTPNLIRYRSILLQGIAVKRITKLHELETEIDVIQREKLNGAPPYEGIPYFSASIENHDKLYEELCWIAKNTASDYQKPFDENAEKLLKSLLEKRKLLNPSYLRVMARYVGLGLLKSQGKQKCY